MHSQCIYLCSVCKSLACEIGNWQISLHNIIIPGTYFTAIMFMVASSCVTTIMILNYHHRMADTHEMPDWVVKAPSFWLIQNILSRLLLSSSNGFHGCLRWPDLVKRSPGRQSWWPRRWRSWTSRRPPPSLCCPMCWTWMMTSGGLLCPGSPPPPPTPVTWRHHRTIREYSGQTKSVSVFISSQSHSSGSTFYFLFCLDGHNIASINYNLGPMSM